MNTNKKFVLFGLAMFLSSVLPAIAARNTFNNDLYFGLRNNNEVVSLQDFLRQEGYFQELSTGNFFALTRDGVAQFQKVNGIAPAAGYFGPKTRAAANAKLTVGVVTPPPADHASAVALLQQQLDTLIRQLALLQAPSTPTEPIAATTTPTAPAVETPAATTTPPVVELPALPNPFDSTLVITSTFPSLTLSRYNDVVLNELTFATTEKIAVTKLSLTNSGTLPDANILNVQLVDRFGAVIAKADIKNSVITFIMVPDASKTDQGLAVSGKAYSIRADIITPNYGAIKPNIRLDIQAVSDVSAFDYNDLTRVATVASSTFPVIGPVITMF